MPKRISVRKLGMFSLPPVLLAVLTACHAGSPLAVGGKALILQPHLASTARHVQALVNPNTAATIDHLTVELFDDSGAEPVLVQSDDLPGADLATHDVTFSNLKMNTAYKVQAIAYASADSATPISVDASSSVTLTTTDDDAPALATLPIVLKDKTFTAAAAAAISVKPGRLLGEPDVATGVTFTATTLAGTTSPGAFDGSGADARFDTPVGIALAPNGHLYVADSGNNSIREVTPAGVVTTLAGSGVEGNDDGSGTEATFGKPYGVAADADGNLYVADYDENDIRKISPAGEVTTLAGSVAAGNTDGTGTDATFDQPIGLAVNASGTVYVADAGNNAIREITPDGVVTTLAGPSSGAGLLDPTGVAVDASGTVYVADSFRHDIRKITPNGVVSTLAGSGMPGLVDGRGTQASFLRPNGVTLDASGNLYVADASAIRKVTPDGWVTTVAGSASTGSADGRGASAGFDTPVGLAMDAAGHLYVADMLNNAIRLLR
ncbi:MAG TPA: NHL repeat-containing protein [Oscillatoriaceae cyanobacterium]